MKRILIFLAFCSLLTFAPSCMSSRQYRYDRQERRDDDGRIVVRRNTRVVRDRNGDRNDRLTRKEKRERERERRHRHGDEPVIIIDTDR
jgi:hypothetical protein